LGGFAAGGRGFAAGGRGFAAGGRGFAAGGRGFAAGLGVLRRRRKNMYSIYIFFCVSVGDIACQRQIFLFYYLYVLVAFFF
jgi:hypothetical protein